MNLVSRRASGIDDLRAAGDLLTRAWRAGSRHVANTPGDLAWWFAQSWPAPLGQRLRLWDLDDRLVAWSWHEGEDEAGPAEIDFHIWSGDTRLDVEVARRLLAQSVAEQGAVDAWGADDDVARIRILEASGFGLLAAGSSPGSGHRVLSQYQRTLDAPIPDATLPAGYRIRPVDGHADLPRRVEAHRAAFAPSRMTIEKYERLIALPLYRPEDDLVVEAPDGSFAAFTMAWWDPVARVGEFEPVGTQPDHQRRGLAKGLLGYALRRYREAGARVVQVFSSADNTASEALYRSLGFEPRVLHRRFRRAAGRP